MDNEPQAPYYQLPGDSGPKKKRHGNYLKLN